MAKLNFDLNVQINSLAIKIANLEVENTRLQAIVQSSNAQIDRLEEENKKLKDGQVKNVKADKKVDPNTQK